MALSRKVRNHLLLSISSLSVAFFIYLATEVREASLGLPELIGQIDLSASERMVAMRTSWLTAIAIAITNLGSGKFLLAVIALVSLLWGLRGRFRLPFFLAVSGVCSSIASALLKTHYARARPASLLSLVEAKGFSFPSGHTLASTAIYLTLTIFLAQRTTKRTARFALVGLGIVLILGIGWSRIYLGVHYFSDVLGGTCVGVSIASLIGAFNRESEF